VTSLLSPGSTRRSVVPSGDLPLCLRRSPVELEVVIPAVNEERRLPRTIAATVAYLQGQPWSSAIVVVDNDSVDRTIDVAERFDGPAAPVHVIGCS
jgi:dolichyl-phosphate beta-glucosyltransferase